MCKLRYGTLSVWTVTVHRNNFIFEKVFACGWSEKPATSSRVRCRLQKEKFDNPAFGQKMCRADLLAKLLFS